jgi:hypothetical protein
MSKGDERREERRARLSFLEEIEERAIIIMEYDGGLLREAAERLVVYDFINIHIGAFKD